jgi:hypothetical protein
MPTNLPNPLEDVYQPLGREEWPQAKTPFSKSISQKSYMSLSTPSSFLQAYQQHNAIYEFIISASLTLFTRCKNMFS